MIHLISGNDNKKKNLYVKKISKGFSFVLLESFNVNKENIIYYASSKSLFGDASAILIENFSKTNIEFNKDEIKSLSTSDNLFIFLEDKLTSSEINKFKKFANIETFNEEKKANKAKDNFLITDSFAVRNKFKTWLLYKDATSKGSSPEEITGILFWKIKTMSLYPNKYFTTSELKTISSNLISLYHDSHTGKKDFFIGLEQFILSSLDKNQKEKA